MKKALLIALAVFSVLGAWSQQRVCGTMHHEQLLMQANPHYAAQRQAVDAYAQNFVMSSSAQRTVITIPVVVHVIYHDSAGNISMAQIQSQIDRLNLDYHKLNADTASIPSVWRSIAADCNIQFCLAQRTPTGTATNGVVRKRINTATSWSDNDAVKYTAQGGDDAWPRASYLNLWVCDLGSGLLGYAQFPGTNTPAATDGVVILNTAFGSVGTATGAPYNKGRTATHEVGHWLNLYHIWGDDGTACNGTDQVSDTPNQAGENYGCPTYPHTDGCATSSPGVMFMNYMDYTDDACMYMFTNGQNTRMQALFATGGARVSLLSSQGCVPLTGVAPTTAFTANKTTICVGQSINFTDQSTGSPTSWSWSFPGAATTTSTAQNPQNIVYNTAGTYSVTLTATNTSGSTPLTKPAYITVLGTTALPLREGFEGSTFPPTGWSLGNGDASTTWARTTSASGFGTSTASAFMDNYNYNASGQKDYLYSPVYSFTSGINASSKLKFDYAYARDQSNHNDTLQVLVSTNCGATWTNLWQKGGTTLQTTTTTYNSTFVPTASQWKRDSTISLAAYAGQTSVQFAFVNINKYGNSLLLDNINIDTVVAATTCTTRPTAAFVASPTTVTAGSTVTFTDQSTNSPTVWAWTFTGGSPASSTAQVPGAITYSTAGTYTAKLRVTNACGSDSTTVTITVVPASTTSGCDTLTHLVVGDSVRLYLAGSTTAAGYVSGSNQYGDLAKAEKFTNVNGRPISSIIFGFVVARSAGATDSLTVNIWDANGTLGLPGTVLGTKKIAMSTVSANVNGSSFQYTVVNFPCPVTTGATFYAGFNINNIAGDTIAVATTSYFNGANHQYQSYELNVLTGGGSAWAAVDSDWGISISNYIFPIQCTQPAPVAAFTANKTSLCPGDSVIFTDLSTNCPTSWSWQVNGPVNLVSSSKNPHFTFTTAGTYTVILNASNAGGNNALTQTSYITVRPNPTDSMSTTPVSCFGGTDGTATVTATGGTSYTYLWAPGGGSTNTISGKPAGTYTVTVTSNYTCSSTASVIISQPFSALTATATFTSAYCGNSNGTVSVTPAGGNGGYTYLWAPGGSTAATVSGLAAGTYTVTVKDSKLCSTVTSTTVTSQTSTVNISFSNVNSTCGASNGTIVATINGSSNGAHYLWSRGDTTGSITNVAPGIYSVTITNALGCSATKSDTLSTTGGPSVTATSTAVSCFGGTNGTATAVGTGTATLTYLWNGSNGTNPALTGKPAGTYTVTVTDGNTCTASTTVAITQPSTAVTASATSTPVNCTTAGTATVTGAGGNSGGYTYLWNPGGQTTQTATNLTAGTYTVTVKDIKLCSAIATVTVADNSPTLSVTITKANATCGNNNGTATANTTATGVTYTWSPGGSHATGLTGLAAGTYSVVITNSNGCSASASTTITNTAGPTVTASATPVSCFGGNNGTATAVASGGTGTLVYAWSGGGSTSSISGKPANTYIVTVTDGNSCQATATAVITQPAAAVTASATSTPVTCTTSGTATVTGTGGNTGGYTYLWSAGSQTTQSISNLSAATYTVTVKDSKLCSATTTVTVADNSVALSVTISKTDATCGNSNGSVTANTTATGVTYTWSPGGSHATSLTGIAAGTYSVTISNANGCSASATTTVQNSNGVNVTLSSTPVSCFNGTDGTATATATGGSGTYTYSWSGGGSSNAITGKTANTYTVTVGDGTTCSAIASIAITQPSSAVSATATSTPVICTTSGTATVVPTGGNSGGYTYLWSNSQTTVTATGLTATTYTVTVRDVKQCSATATVTIADNSPTLSVNITKVDATCGNSNGSATSHTTASGVTYLWSPGGSTASALSGVSAGTYSVTITNSNGCSASATTTIQNTSGPTLQTSSVSVTCHGGSDGKAIVTATAGSGTYVYSWAGGGNADTLRTLPAGTYAVTVTDGACSTTATVIVSEPTAVVVQTTSSPVICTTLGTATATGSGGSGTGYTYLWSNTMTTPTISGLAASTTYTVTVRDSKLCTATASATITTQASTLTDSVSSTNATSPTSANGTATAHPVGGNAAFSYSWNNSQLTQTATQLLPGTYTCTITDANGCTTVATVTVGSGPNAITDINATVHYTVTPNPATDKCTVTIEMNETLPVEMSIYSLIGQKVWSKDLGHIRSVAEVVDIHDLAEGVYIVKIKAGTQTFSTRLIRQ